MDAGPRTPSRTMRAPVRYAICPARGTAPGSRHSRGATCRVLRRSRSWSMPCPWCCSGRADGAESQRRLAGTAPRRFRLPRTSAGAPDHGAGADQLALVPAVEHRATRQHDRGNIDGGAAIIAAGVVLSQPVVSTTASIGIAVQDLHQAEIGQVRGRSPRSAACSSRRSGGSGIPAGCRPRRGCRRVPAAPDRYGSVAGRRSLPVWAIPIIGLPERSSSGVVP